MSVLIKNGNIYDGKNTPTYKADVLIRGDRIVDIGKHGRKETEKIIDATDCIVMPGIIDVNSGSDHYLNLLSDPHQETFIKSGVTSIIGGNCGSSLAPYSRTGLMSVRKWGIDIVHETNIDWQTFKEFLSKLEKRGVGLNFGTLVGHYTLRSELTKKEGIDLTDKEIKNIIKIIEKIFKNGAKGLSFGLEYSHSKNIQNREFKKIIEGLNNLNKIFTFHLHSYEKLEESIKQVSKFFKNGSDIHFSHLQPITSNLEEYKKLQEILDNQKLKNISYDCNPYPASVIPIYKFLPEWAQKNTLEEMVNTLKNHGEKIKEHLKSITSKKVIVAKTTKEFNFYEDKTIKEISENLKKTQIETLYDLMIKTNLKTVCLYHNINEKVLDEIVFSEKSLIASNGINILVPGLNVFEIFLKKAIENKEISLEKAIEKITHKPAERFKIKDRGVLEKNLKADVVVIKDFKVKDSILNGDVCLEDGQIKKEKLSGQIIK
ncbi:MAG: hypothetical protein WDZ80_03900 [Candidatus Paceibacterota bacterium]